MDGQERILHRLFSHKKCHNCDQAYLAEGILVLARRSDVWMVMISCAACEQKDTFVVKFPSQLQGRRHVTSYRISRPPEQAPATPQTTADTARRAPQPPLPPRTVNADDVLNMHLFLKHFNGDFQHLFSEVD
jgi:hypothetical protein